MRIRLFSFLTISALSLLLFTCEREGTEPLTEQEADLQTSISREVLTTPRAFVEGVAFPIGTRLAPDGDGGLAYTLPTGYRHLWIQSTTGLTKLGGVAGGYTCSCSKKGSCTVFNTQQTGYGCLQSSCSGSCTGKPADDDEARVTGGEDDWQFGGFVYDDPELRGGRSEFPASLTIQAHDLFFTDKQVNETIRENYEFAYTHRTMPDFSSVELGDIPVGYALVHVNIRGVDFGMLLPDQGTDLEDMFVTSDILRPGSTALNKASDYSCTGSNGCSCEGDKKCRFGFCVYTCTGCTSCTLEVEK